MNGTTDCPDRGELRSLLEGGLTGGELARLSAHLDRCEACQGALEALAAEGGPGWAIDRAEEGPEADGPGLRGAIDRLKRAETVTATAPGAGGDGAEPDLDFLDPPETPGRLGRLGPYEVIGVVGRGGMGVVLRAFDPSLHRFVAIKVLHPRLATSATSRRRFLREARAAAAVSHDHVVTIHAVDEWKGLPYLVMRLVVGGSLQERIDRSGPLEVREILRIGMQTAAGLAAAHAQGLMHRDVKPGNILLENGVERVKLTDFGLARAVDDADLTGSGVVAGTPSYMAPEQARGDPIDHRADLFSLGSVLYAMCTGHPPFRGSTTMAVLRRVSDEEPRPIRETNPEVPEWLVALIGRLHAKDPADRIPSATEVAEILGRHLADAQRPPTPGPSPSSRRRARTQKPGPLEELPTAPDGRRTVPAALLVLATIAAALLLVFLIRSVRTSLGPPPPVRSQSADGTAPVPPDMAAPPAPGTPGPLPPTRRSRAPRPCSPRSPARSGRSPSRPTAGRSPRATTTGGSTSGGGRAAAGGRVRSCGPTGATSVRSPSPPTAGRSPRAASTGPPTSGTSRPAGGSPR